MDAIGRKVGGGGRGGGGVRRKGGWERGEEEGWMQWEGR